MSRPPTVGSASIAAADGARGRRRGAEGAAPGRSPGGHREVAPTRYNAGFITHALRLRPSRGPPAHASGGFMQYIYTMNGVSKIVPPKRQIIKDISLSFFPGAKIGLLGLNGAGKSTVLRIMAGVDKDFQGEARPQPGIKVGYLAQEPELDPEKTVREAVEEGVSVVINAQKRLEEVYAAYAEEGADFDKLAQEQQELENILAVNDAHALERQLEVAADALRLPPWDAKIGPLSGGEKRRVALCRLLLSKPDMLLLDEPTNHLDAESVDWLEQFLQNYPGTVVAVTHDRYFLDNAAEWILELDRGRGIPWKGNYTEWLEQKDQRLKQEAQQEKARQKAIEKELEWVRSASKGRQSKGKARLNRFEELNAVEYQKRNETNEIFIPPGERLGQEVIEFKNVSKSFGDRLLIDDLSFKVPPGAIVGVIGPNGAGKSTLFKLITGVEKPDQGEVKIGHTVKLAYVDQSRGALDPKNNVWQEVSGGLDILTIGNFEIQSRAYIGRFNFKGTDQQKIVGNLSGGERGRLHLAKTLLQGGNVLLLDEPSNDLDVETLRALEDALLEFPGCAMVISHDRWFLDRIATHILAFEGDSHVEFFPGNYNEYEADKKRRLGDEAARPHRVKYKKLA
jgi:ATP-binding cassette ChvD family protein